MHCTCETLTDVPVLWLREALDLLDLLVYAEFLDVWVKLPQLDLVVQTRSLLDDLVLGNNALEQDKDELRFRFGHYQTTLKRKPFCNETNKFAKFTT